MCLWAYWHILTTIKHHFITIAMSVSGEQSPVLVKLRRGLWKAVPRERGILVSSLHRWILQTFLCPDKKNIPGVILCQGISIFCPQSMAILNKNKGFLIRLLSSTIPIWYKIMSRDHLNPNKQEVQATCPVLENSVLHCNDLKVNWF